MAVRHAFRHSVGSKLQEKSAADLPSHLRRNQWPISAPPKLPPWPLANNQRLGRVAQSSREKPTLQIGRPDPWIRHKTLDYTRFGSANAALLNCAAMAAQPHTKKYNRGAGL
jgi:hypothetical protein